MRPNRKVHSFVSRVVKPLFPKTIDQRFGFGQSDQVDFAFCGNHAIKKPNVIGHPLRQGAMASSAKPDGPPEFSLLQLQQTVEALAGRGLHKQNFRRQIEQQALVEETGQIAAGAAGRPAKLFRFRRNVILERAMSGNKLPLARG